MESTTDNGRRAAGARDALRAVFPGGSDMAARCRALDWADTPLGPVEAWPQSLRTAAGLALGAAFPMILLWGPALVQLYNDGSRAVMGAKHPAGLGQPTRECWPEVWHINAPIYARVRAGETVWVEEARYPLLRRGPDAPPDDVYIDVSFSPVPDEAGGVGGVLVTLLDVTARVAGRAAEAERARLAAALEAERTSLLEDVFRQAPSFLHVLRGPAFVFELANDAYHRLVGRGDLVGRAAFEVLPEAAGGGFPERIARVMATGEPFAGRELPVTLARTPGAPPEERLLDLVYLPLLEPDGTCERVLGHGTDVTEHVHARREAEAALVQRTAAAEAARADAEAANRAKAEFLAVMSHELRTPLNAIGGYAELIELGIHGPVTPEQRTALARVQASQRHLLGLIAGVLDYSRVEAGAVTYRLTDVPVTEGVAEAEVLVAPQLRAKGLGYGWSGAAPGLCVRADREKLQQVLLNLLGNAVKFTHERGGVPGRVEVACSVEDGAGGQGAAGGRVRIHVRDTGEGIAADELERVFEPFVQADQRLTRPHAGVGLGLAISRDLARGMGGDLTAESTPGAGSTFTLTLPRGGTPES